jgi:hypothetical protein
MLVPEIIFGAANAAVEKSEERKMPLSFESSTWESEEMKDESLNGPSSLKSTLERQKERTSIALAADIMLEERATVYVHDDSAQNVKNTKFADEEEEVIPWYKRALTFIGSALSWIFSIMTLNSGNIKNEWKRHSEALFSISDAIAEALITGRGPYGFMGLEGGWFALFKYAQNDPYLRCLQQPWLNTYDENGNNKNVVILSEPLGLSTLLQSFRDLDKALNYSYFEETRCAIHFLLLLMIHADSKTEREKILFQKFLRDNRFKLASMGITPPKEIFASDSFSSMSLPLVSSWLLSLNPHELTQFHSLKNDFMTIERERDEAIDNDDYRVSLDSVVLKKERAGLDAERSKKLQEKVTAYQMEKVQSFMDSLTATERKVFVQRRDVWLKDADCAVDIKDEELYNKFREACMKGSDERLDYTRLVCYRLFSLVLLLYLNYRPFINDSHLLLFMLCCHRYMLSEIEAAQVDCRVGEYGRTYQYVDSTFFPSEVSIGDISNADKILGWRCAPGICAESTLFHQGSFVSLCRLHNLIPQFEKGRILMT